jgi:hypothetical protein
MDKKPLLDNQSDNQTDFGKHRLVINRYFTTLNLGQFDAAAALFAVEGEMHPPVDEPVIGRSAIEAYLHEAAVGLRLEPLHYQSELLSNGQTQVTVLGRVQICPFGSNVAWIFVLNPQGEIARVVIELRSDD